MLLDEIVDLRADTADDFSVPLCEPELRPGVLEPRILARRDKTVDFLLERRDPGRIVAVDLPGEVHEGLLIGLGFDGTYGDAACHGAGASSWRGRAPAMNMLAMPPAWLGAFIVSSKSRHYLHAETAIHEHREDP